MGKLVIKNQTSVAEATEPSAKVALRLGLYDPLLLSENDFLLSFVARHSNLEIYLKHIRRSTDLPKHKAPTHWVFYAQRGMGKTSLLRRIAIEVNNNDDLKQHWISLNFREEQYNVASLNDFLMNCLDALANWCEEQGDHSSAEQLDALMITQREAQDYWSAMQAIAASNNRRLLLLIDNIDLVINNIPKQQQWAFRKLLQTPESPLVIGATSNLPESFADRDFAFFDFFHLSELTALEAQEMQRCLFNLAKIRGAYGEKVITQLQESSSRIEVLHNLCGGNPRTLGMIYEVLEGIANTENLASTEFSTILEGVLDSATPLYKARTEELSLQQRRILDAIALNWDPITAKQISMESGISMGSINPQLARLEADGIIMRLDSKAKNSHYQIVERFYNIWYLMRHGSRRTKNRLHWLTHFLESFYKKSDLVRLGRQALKSPTLEYNSYSQALHFSIQETNVGKQLGDKLTQTLVDKVNQLLENSPQDITDDDIQGLIDANIKNSIYYFNLGNDLNYKVKHYQGAEQAYRQALAIDSEYVFAWHNLGVLLIDHFSRHQDAELCYRQVLAIDSETVYAWNNLGSLLMDFYANYSEAKAAFEKAITIDEAFFIPHYNLAWLSLLSGNKANIELKQLPEVSQPGKALLQAAIYVTEQNLGLAFQLLDETLNDNLDDLWSMCRDDLLRLIRLIHQQQLGPQLLAWFDSSGQAIKQAPLYAAARAYIDDADYLNQINPEVRTVAQSLYQYLHATTITPTA